MEKNNYELSFHRRKLTAASKPSTICSTSTELFITIYIIIWPFWLHFHGVSMSKVNYPTLMSRCKNKSAGLVHIKDKQPC